MPEISGIKLNYIEKGEGFPLILIHGLSDDLRLWAPLIPQLSRNYRTVSLDLRGHGSSGKPKGHYSIEQFSRDIYFLLNELSIKKAHFIGFSLGGAVVQDLAVNYPEMVSSIVLMSSFSFVDLKLNETFLKLRESLVEGGFAAFFDEILPLVLTPELINENRAELEQVREEKIKTESVESLINTIDACMEFDVKDKISVISKPALIISGKEDVLIPDELARQVHRIIDGSKLIILENTGHNVLIPENLQFLLELILKFLKDV
ncbi:MULTISPECIES: alpha/beta fold hydrolase [Methanobacterium]|uniref:Alpha/beta fold hydrolase n=1 Tax=Methanobacterium veterum TaxID=408577 RepID=A0A9E4ZZV3_9EURY|nr:MULTISPECIES: alpha/beta fold hydrolase [Methanobacterium]MCZ3366279.1 alpha/beta fold hydrolase [Methanobacterium veterum]MCZ3371787.1 alpha/beta fold hydrolase [Methanobacterium veterum]